MYVTETANGDRHEVQVTGLEEKDLKAISVKRFAFDWKRHIKNMNAIN